MMVIIEDDYDEIAYFSVRWKTERAKNIWGFSNRCDIVIFDSRYCKKLGMSLPFGVFHDPWPSQ